MSEGVRSILDDAEGRLSTLRDQLDTLQSALGEWEELATSAGQETGITQGPDDEAEAESVEPAAQVEAELEEDEPIEEEPPEVDAVDASADMSPADQDIFGDSDDEVSFDAGDSEGDIALDLVGGGNAGEASGDEIAIDLDSAGSDDAEADAKKMAQRNLGGHFSCIKKALSRSTRLQ